MCFPNRSRRQTRKDREGGQTSSLSLHRGHVQTERLSWPAETIMLTKG
jgi:hypothetical protein